MATTTTAVLFISCCEAVGSIFCPVDFPCVGASGSYFEGIASFEAFFDSACFEEAVAALWMGFEGWLFDGLIFEGVPSVGLRPAFFVRIRLIVDPKFHSRNCLFQFIVVANCAFCVYNHSRRH